ncbi:MULTISPECIES: GntR family transcriptional regulator [Sinorhizobium]|uniref:GntR family transcriptional regulator n=2 Tax=Sinorhizobium TaxID=28105 RepID=A0A2S3YJI4_9HYPH|nr:MULTISPECIES: GntR family transcriptional regulator [Sinorhizobium]AUX79676.1 GntR family transcriptional regulator protein [Sinorhizobium fredii]PDT41319.1 GntR family transcriptional regulator [Sinorhizobium sp. FG01]PDT53431.1 GntR family transcriptional regulator [Sinorhizobium sp. NG07B]POH27524.1 GntR family transcriptional regulator [Sinorhizobium americanum]POH29591.1 GntR family transcriptional regulator [Sinorhizobium americanum]
MNEITSLERRPEGGPGPIRRTALHDTLVSHLRDMIIEGDLPPGTRLHEGQLGEQLGVSRTPLREAIKYLASEGLVELVPSRGAVVKRFSAKDVKDMLTVLQSLEELAGRLACEAASDAEIAEIRALHDEMVARYKAGDRLQYYKLNQQIHTAIAQLSGNAALADMHAMLQTRLKRIRFIGHEGPEKWAAAVAEHEEMIATLEARDKGKLSEVLGRHLTKAWERVRDSV